MSQAPNAAEFARTRLGIELDEVQEHVMLSHANRGILNCTRQWGKSTVGAAKALYRAMSVARSLVLVPNPVHHPQGDFALQAGSVREQGVPRWTYAGIGLYRPELFEGCTPGRFPLRPLLQRAIAGGRLHGELYQGVWCDVGSIERLAALQ